MKFTEQAVSKLKPSDKQVDYSDELTKGLILRVGKSGKKSWQVRYRADGKQHRQSIGNFPHVSLKEAREQVRRIQAAVIDGENPAFDKRRTMEAKSRIRQTLQISNLLQLYDQLHLSQLRTGYQARTFLREFAKEFGHANIKDFTKQDFVGL